MSYSSSTLAAESSWAEPAARPIVAHPGRFQTAVTVVLLGAWLVLMAFGVISLMHPAWLTQLGKRGVDAEARLYLKYGDSHMRQHDYPGAIRQYWYALNVKPGNPAVMVNLAVAHIQLREWPKAASLLHQIERMEIRPRLRSTVYLNLALVAEQQQKPEEAIAYCQQALENAAEPEKVYRKLGTLYIATRRFAEARSALEQALAAQLDPALPYRKMLARAADSELAEPGLAAELEQRLAAGVQVEDLQPYDVDTLRSLQAGDRDVSVTRALLGACCAQLTDYTAARQHLEEALRIWPENAEARQNLDHLRHISPRP